MDEQALRALVNWLRPRVAAVRAARGQTPGLMPDERTLARELSVLEAEFEGCTDPRIFWVVAGFLLYGDGEGDFAPERVEHAVGYLCRWERLNATIVFRGVALLQLVFLYALGVRRSAGGVAGETTAQALAWGGAPWSGAFDALRWYLIGQGGWLITQLRRLGFRHLEILGEFVGDPDGLYAHRLADHTIGVLLGHTHCLCAPLFRAAHPGSPKNAPARRHQCWHLLTGYLDKHWPQRRDYHLRPFGVSEHVFRAVCGDEPTRPRSFETGIWFWLVRSTDASLAVVKVLACQQCRNHLAWFDVCSECNTPWPDNVLVDWIVSEDNNTFRPAEGKECRRCGRLAPLDQERCPCGSPGVGFSRVVRGTGRVECLACRERLPRGVHACPHSPCLNADYGRETHFYFRQEVPAQLGFVGPLHGGAVGGSHRRRGRSKPLAAKPAEDDSSEESPPGQCDSPEPQRPIALSQTPLPISMAMTFRGPRSTEPQQPNDSAPDTTRAGTPAANRPEGSDS